MADILKTKPRKGSVGKILENQTRNQPKIFVSFRTGPRTARELELVLEADSEPPENFNQF